MWINSNIPLTWQKHKSIESIIAGLWCCFLAFYFIGLFCCRKCALSTWLLCLKSLLKLKNLFFLQLLKSYIKKFYNRNTNKYNLCDLLLYYHWHNKSTEHWICYCLSLMLFLSISCYWLVLYGSRKCAQQNYLKNGSWKKHEYMLKHLECKVQYLLFLK